MKWRTLQQTTIIQVVGVSHVLDLCKKVSHILEICATKERRLLQYQVQLDIEAKVQQYVSILE